jgi:hypothetical protein
LVFDGLYLIGGQVEEGVDMGVEIGLQPDDLGSMLRMLGLAVLQPLPPRITVLESNVAARPMLYNTGRRSELP